MSHKSLKSINPAPRSIAPSQLKKMYPVQHISLVVCYTARQDIECAGMKIATGEKFLLVQASRFPGYAYVVRWSVDGIGECSCGRPGGCDHRTHAAEYTRNRVKTVVTPEKKDIRGTVEWYADQSAKYEAARQAVRDEEALVAEIKSEFASVVVDAIAAKINAEFSKTVVRRGIFLLAQQEVAA